MGVKKSKMTTLLLCIFLGWLGAHRFYTGKGFTGILYLFTLGFSGIGIVIDLVLILTGSFRDKSGFPLTQAHSKISTERNQTKENTSMPIKLDSPTNFPNELKKYNIVYIITGINNLYYTVPN